MDRSRKARNMKRSRQEIAVVNGKPDALPSSVIEIGMRYGEGRSFSRRCLAKAVDIVMAVALGMGNAEKGAEREILLHGKAGLAGEVLTGDEEFFPTRAPFRRARGVDDGLVEPLAGFRGDAAIAERPRRRERVVGIMGFVEVVAVLG